MVFEKKRIILIAAIVQIIFIFTAYSSMAQDSFIVLDSKNVSEMLENIKYIEDFGGKATHRFPPNVIIGDIPTENISKIKENIHIININTIDTINTTNVTVTANIENSVINNNSVNDNGKINETNFGDQYGKTAEIAAYIWNNNYIHEAEKRNISVTTEQKLSNENINILENLSLINDTLIRQMPISNEGPKVREIASSISEVTEINNGEGNNSRNINNGEGNNSRNSSTTGGVGGVGDVGGVGFSNDIIPSKPYGAGFYDTSDYLMGDIAISIIFPESNGSIDSNLEDWSSEEIQTQVGNVQKGLNWLATRDNRSKLTFTYEIKSQMPTSYEPVTRFPDDDTSWITDIMNDMGYNKYYFLLDNVQDYDNVLRDIYKTDWAYTMFVIKSKSCQTCNPTGHAYLGGPYAVVRDGLDYFDTIALIAAHETGHIFYATDEYNGITEYSGYLNASDDENSFCLMYTVWQPLLGNTCISSGTQLQYGWRDSDNNNIFDIIDSAPAIVLDTYQPGPLTFTGTATTIGTYPNNNPVGTKNGITINKITKVEYNIDNGNWSTTTPIDGSFDNAIEGFIFTIPKLSDGVHTIQLGTVNTVGYWAYTSKNITVNSSIDSNNVDKLNPNDNLKIDQSISSQDGRFKLIMQGDGNLVLYDSGMKPLWDTGTWGHPGAWFIVQNDGNAVVYDSNNTPLWDAGTWGRPGAWFIVQNDGNVVIYDSNYKPLWATGTKG